MNQVHFEWKWHWRIGDDGLPDCGIYAEQHPGHAYAICRCPRYLSEKEWAEYAQHICDLHNAAIKKQVA